MMEDRRMRTLLISLPALVLAAGAARGELIAIGLSWNEKVFVQEYWRLGWPYFGITNVSDKAVAVTMIDREGKGEGPWRVKAGASKGFRVNPAKQTGEMVRLRNADRGLGTTELPKDEPPAAANGFASCVGLNGSGGHDAGLWMVQRHLRYPSGTVIEVTFLVKSRPGVLSLFKTPNGTPPGGLAFASAKEVTCDTLPVRADAKAFYVDTTNPKKAAEWHRITARFQAPDVKRLTLALIDGWMAGSGGGGHGLARGVVVAPQEKQDN
jgi:hypothetical protein